MLTAAYSPVSRYGPSGSGSHRHVRTASESQSQGAIALGTASPPKIADPALVGPAMPGFFPGGAYYVMPAPPAPTHEPISTGSQATHLSAGKPWP